MAIGTSCAIQRRGTCARRPRAQRPGYMPGLSAAPARGSGAVEQGGEAMMSMEENLALRTASEVMSRYAGGQRGADIIGPIKDAIQEATKAKDAEIETLRRQIQEIHGNRAYRAIEAAFGCMTAERVLTILDDVKLKIVPK